MHDLAFGGTMKQVYLLYKFNAYRNRQIKRYETVADYLSAAYDYDAPANQKNFAYNDGVNTEMTIKQDPGAKYSPDYCLIVDKDGNIESRWYVIESDKLMDTSYKLRLHRDLVADNFSEIMTAPAFIEKATVNPADPVVFNQEQITVNQIKTSEKLLKDNSKMAWIVGYMAKDAVAASTTIQFGPKRVPDYTFADEAGFIANKPSVLNGSIEFTNVDPGSQLPTSATTPAQRANKYLIEIAWYDASLTNEYRILRAKWTPGSQIDILNNDEGYAGQVAAFEAGYNMSGYKSWRKATLLPNTFANNACNTLNSYRAEMGAQIDSYGAISFDSPLAPYDNKIFRIGTKYYKTRLESSSAGKSISTKFASNATNDINTAIRAINWDSTETQVNNSVQVGYTINEDILVFDDITSGQYSLTLDGNEIELNEQPYKMFAIPYSREKDIKIGAMGPWTMPMEFGLLIANAISTKYSGAGSLYDLQLLPYCPLESYIVGDHQMALPSNSDEYTYVKDSSNNNVGIIYWCTENTFTFDISESIVVNNVKLESITDMYRISSPNWNGQFEFNASKNGGVSKFNVDCTYKPFTPYIHVNPNFGRLYGQDFDDARGLICSGDFSLPQIRDEWQTYELQNKNYQNQFDRQIANLELTQDVALKKQLTSAAFGAVGGAVSGGSTGLSLGGPGGAVAGAIAGAGMSLLGAAQDEYYTRKLNAETIDYSQDQFRMRNENIQALPDSLKQVGALTANNKLFPVLEYYTCTPEEKTAIELKLQYNGMTVERIGTIAEFIQETETYIKAKLIRLNLEEDNHYLEALAQELNKGVFIKA